MMAPLTRAFGLGEFWASSGGPGPVCLRKRNPLYLSNLIFVRDTQSDHTPRE
jgi:hypothetical protein